MRIDKIRISGFKAIPHCAECDEETFTISWNQDAFEIILPSQGTAITPMISAIIGSNSCGKSSVLIVLAHFFGSTTKMRQELFHGGNNQIPIIVEIDFSADLPKPRELPDNYITIYDQQFKMTVANLWLGESRTTLVKSNEGTHVKVGSKEKKIIQNILPQYRMISADTKLSEEGNPEKSDVISDLVKEVLAKGQKSSNRSLLRKLNKALANINELVDRSSPPNNQAWHEIEEFESLLSDGISPITPGNPQVRLQFSKNIPTLEQIFLKSKVNIQDGIELEFNEHGLGLQRSFAVSAMSAWCKWVGCKQGAKDYFFGIEEPELYLHPHAIRVLLTILEEIAQQNQVIFTSHSTEFVNRVPLDHIIRIDRCNNNREVIQPDFGFLPFDLQHRVERHLCEDRSDMLFARSVLLVEGPSELLSFPSFAQTIGFNLDKEGVSVVSVNGKENFEIYHNILNAFKIPHVIFADGDGLKNDREIRYRPWASSVFVLEEDYEFLIANSLSQLGEDRFLEIVNDCRRNRGKPLIKLLDLVDLTVDSITKHWWENLKEDIDGDIAEEFRSDYEIERTQIRELLRNTASRLVNNNHSVPTAPYKKRATILKKQGKPLVGRVLGKMLTKEEITFMSIIPQTIEATILLARRGTQG